MRLATSSFLCVKFCFALLILIISVSIIYTISAYYIFFETEEAEEWLNRPNFYSNYCVWNDNIYVSRNGLYELKLCYKSTHNNFVPPAPTPMIEERKIRINGSSRRLRFEDLASIPDAEWLTDFDRSVYKLYPQSIPLRDTLQSLINGEPISQPPIFNPRIRFLQIPTNVCSPLTPEQTFFRLTDELSFPYVVIIYKSGVYNFKERSRLRKLYHLSYTNINIHLIFSIGLPRTSQGNVFQRDGFNVTLAGRAGQMLLEHSNFPLRTKRMFAKEMYTHNDLLIGDYEDSYYNLTLKLFHTFQWAARFCRPYKPIFVFLDDDYAVNTNKLVKFIRNLTSESRENLGYGYDMMVNPVFRYASTYPQWAFSKREIPWPMHTPELLGIYSIWSYRHVHDMALAMHFTKPMVIDDTWLAMVQHKLNLTFTRLKGMHFLAPSQPNRLDCSDIFFAPVSEFKRNMCIL